VRAVLDHLREHGEAQPNIPPLSLAFRGRPLSEQYIELLLSYANRRLSSSRAAPYLLHASTSSDSSASWSPPSAAAA
jgi:hypothetical protein